MALTTTGIAVPPRWFNTSALGALVMDAAAEKVAMILQVLKVGNIAKVGFLTGTVTVADGLAVNLETVDATTGAPTGTAYKGAAAGLVAMPAATTAYTATLATPATAVVQGDTIAVVLSFSAYVAGNLQIAVGSTTGDLRGLPYCALLTAAWVKSTNRPVCWLEYDDGSYAVILGVLPGASLAAWAYKSDTAGYDEYGLLFTAPCNMTVRGWWAYMLPGDLVDIVLYKDTTELAVCRVDNDVTQATGAANQLVGVFPSAVNLVSGVQYRVAMRPAATNANSNLYYLVTPSAAAMGAMPLGTSAFACRRLNLGAWDDTLTTYRPQIGVMT